VADLYPPTVPYDQGMLDVGDGNLVYWETCGTPDGKPALIVHGGPGSGCRPGQGRIFNPASYRIILFDQRGCGRSTPHASDPATDMRFNTTPHLVADMERLRQHLGVERWLLSGYSWGSTLSLAYAQAHPEHVSEIVLAPVTTTSRAEIEWLYRGAGRFYPREWEQFLAGVPGTPPDGDIVGAYARLMEHPDPAVRAKAADDWSAWEDTLLSWETSGKPFGGISLERRLALVRICAHYFSHGGWLEDDQLVRNASRLAGIPGLLVHGRFDMSGPVDTAWRLSRAWPGAELIVMEDAGHVGNAAETGHVMRALARFAAA
jgi:proline iminopeptidase